MRAQSPATAAQRFYAAFYRYSVLFSASSAQPSHAYYHAAPGCPVTTQQHRKFASQLHDSQDGDLTESTLARTVRETRDPDFGSSAAGTAPGLQPGFTPDESRSRTCVVRRKRALLMKPMTRRYGSNVFVGRHSYSSRRYATFASAIDANIARSSDYATMPHFHTGLHAFTPTMETAFLSSGSPSMTFASEETSTSHKSTWMNKPSRKLKTETSMGVQLADTSQSSPPATDLPGPELHFYMHIRIFAKHKAFIEFLSHAHLHKDALPARVRIVGRPSEGSSHMAEVFTIWATDAVRADRALQRLRHYWHRRFSRNPGATSSSPSVEARDPIRVMEYGRKGMPESIGRGPMRVIDQGREVSATLLAGDGESWGFDHYAILGLPKHVAGYVVIIANKVSRLFGCQPFGSKVLGLSMPSPDLEQEEPLGRLGLWGHNREQLLEAVVWLQDHVWQRLQEHTNIDGRGHILLKVLGEGLTAGASKSAPHANNQPLPNASTLPQPIKDGRNRPSSKSKNGRAQAVVRSTFSTGKAYLSDQRSSLRKDQAEYTVQHSDDIEISQSDAADRCPHPRFKIPNEGGRDSALRRIATDHAWDTARASWDSDENARSRLWTSTSRDSLDRAIVPKEVIEAEMDNAEPNEIEADNEPLFPEFDAGLAHDVPGGVTEEANSPPFERRSPSRSGATERPAIRRISGSHRRAYSTESATPPPTPSAPAAPEGSQTTSASAAAKLDRENGSSTSTSDQLAEDLKAVLRSLTNPVVLITSSGGDKRGTTSYEQAHGVTISSFTTVSLSPAPVISFNLKIPSRTWDAIAASKRMRVHLLTATREGAAVAHAFTQPFNNPATPFRDISRYGVSTSAHARKTYAPKLSGPGIAGWLTASLMAEKCIRVGDHVIVVAEVLAVMSRPGEEDEIRRHSALSYAMKGYRDIGARIIPFAPLKLATAESGKHMPSAADGPASRNLNPRKGSTVIAPSTEILSSKNTQHADSGDEGHARVHKTAASDLEQAEKATQEKASTHSSPALMMSTPLSTDLAPEIPKAGHKPKLGSARPWGLSARTKASYSTLSWRHQQHRRMATAQRFSTSAANPRSMTPSDGRVSNAYAGQVASPELLRTTVADFLAPMYQKGATRPRVRGLIRARKAANDASAELESALANGTLTADESTHLENIVSKNERLITKTLARNAVRDLRLVLNRGRADHPQVAWLESCIEKGQAVLLDEARQLKRWLEDGKVSREQFQALRVKLEEQNALLSSETARLNQMVDEEAEAGNQQPVDRKQFDGFQGNV